MTRAAEGMRRFVSAIVHVVACVAFCLTTLDAVAQEYAPPCEPPTGDDYSHPSLREFQARLLARHGHYRNIPLDEKAEYFEWEMWRYHLTDFKQIYSRVQFSDQKGVKTVSMPLRDMSTWNGSVIAALSYKYAVTKEPETLVRLAELIRGMHLFFEVMQVPGLMARSIHPFGERPNAALGEFYEQPTADGRKWWVCGDPAKGGYNQIAGGYAALMMFAYADLPPDVQQMAHDDMTKMIVHMIRNNWKATDAAGKPTSFGDLTPLVGEVGVPFNAQVAYQLVALGFTFPSTDPHSATTINNEYFRLRGKHCYYGRPIVGVTLPQRVAASPFVKGMNDRNHVMNAAFVGLLLERHRTGRIGQLVDVEFTHQLGLTLLHGMGELYDKRNSLCTFMWAGLTRDRTIEASIMKSENDRAKHRVYTARSLVDAVEQLRRFKLQRWVIHGKTTETDQLQWCDTAAPDDSHWKVNPKNVFQEIGPDFNQAICAMDYLYAYWLFRYFQLEQHQTLRGTHADVMVRTPGLRTWSAE